MSESLTFQIALGLQSLYVALGAGYNLVSMARRARGKGHLAPTNPRTGLAFMAVLVVPIAMGWAGWRLAFAVLWGLLVPLLLTGGVLPHARALATGGAELERYASRMSCQLALLINLFGLATIASGLLLLLV